MHHTMCKVRNRALTAISLIAKCRAVLKFATLLAFALCCLGLAVAQDPPGVSSYEKVPVITGGSGVATTFSGGTTSLSPNITPVILLPVGDKWLIESRVEVEGDFEHEPGDGSFHGPVNKEIQYAQVDYLAGKYVTLTAGRFLTPFGVYNERLYPIWVRNLLTDPLIMPIGGDASTGGMVRGGFELSANANLNYAAYYSASSTVRYLESDRSTGGRVGVFLPKRRFELGVSFQRRLQDGPSTLYGAHAEWQPRSTPLDVRAEYAYSQIGKGFWVESAYRPLHSRSMPLLTQHAQFVLRLQDFHLSKAGSQGASDSGLPSDRTRMFEFGTNYYFKDGLRAMSSYGRQFSPAGNANVWTVGMSYRFAIPLGRSGR